MVKVLRPPHAFERSRRALRTALCVDQVYGSWMHRLAMQHERLLRDEWMEQVGRDFAMKRGYEHAIHQYEVQRRFRYTSSSDSSDKSDDDQDKIWSKEEEMEGKEEQDVEGLKDRVCLDKLSLCEDDIYDYRDFLQHQAERAQMESSYEQRFQLPDAFDQAKEQHFSSGGVYDEVPLMPILLYNQAPARAPLQHA